MRLVTVIFTIGTLLSQAWTTGAVLGQRIVPLNVAPAAPTASGTGSIPGPIAGYSQPPGTFVPNPNTTFAPYGTGAGTPETLPVYPNPPGYPNYAPGHVPGYAPGAPPNLAPGLCPGPAARFQGGIHPPPAWDPYGISSPQQPALFPRDPNFPSGNIYPQGSMAQMQRFLTNIELDYLWMPGNGLEEMGLHDADLSATFAIPFFYNTQTPLYVTPGFAVQFWNGPSNHLHDMPPRTYEAYLQGAWIPQINDVLEAEVVFRAGVYSDFSKLTNDSLRYQGRGLLTLSTTPSFTIKAGVIYLDRVRVKLLPTGGFIWTPEENPDIRFEVLFPNPKLAFRLTTDTQNREWWLYGRGDYGGSSWTVKRIGAFPEFIDQVDHNYMEAAVGLEWNTPSGSMGLIEVGCAFERELYFRSGIQSHVYTPNITVFVGGSLVF